MRPRLKVVIWLFVLMLRTTFFFQAEDGIRDLTVTGVQTCALPILSFWEIGPKRRESVDSFGLSPIRKYSPFSILLIRLMMILSRCWATTMSPTLPRDQWKIRTSSSGTRVGSMEFS